MISVLLLSRRILVKITYQRELLTVSLYHLAAVPSSDLNRPSSRKLVHCVPTVCVGWQRRHIYHWSCLEVCALTTICSSIVEDASLLEHDMAYSHR
jgi:hypothetical protein